MPLLSLTADQDRVTADVQDSVAPLTGLWGAGAAGGVLSTAVVGVGVGVDVGVFVDVGGSGGAATMGISHAFELNSTNSAQIQQFPDPPGRSITHQELSLFRPTTVEDDPWLSEPMIS